MSRFQQNIIYVGLIVAIFSFFWVISPSKKYEAHGVYLPQTTQSFSPVELRNVSFQEVGETLPWPFIGVVQVETHYTDAKDIKAACEKGIKKAKELAAKNGASKLIGSCSGSGQAGPLDGAGIKAYAYH